MPISRARKAKTPSQPRGELRVNLLLDAAAELVLIHGPEGLRMDMVAKQAATSPGSLYQFFPNRDALLSALMVRYGKVISTLAEDAAKAQTAHPPTSSAEAVQDFSIPFLDFYAQNRAYVILAEASSRVFKDPSQYFPEDDDVVRALRKVLKPFVSAAQKRRLESVCRMSIAIFHRGVAESLDLSIAERETWLVELEYCIQSYVATLH